MADVFSKTKRARVMAAIQSRGNKDTELKLISIFRSNRIAGWRRNQRIVGRPDFVFRKARVVVFVDGCFWHGCPKHGRKPDSNRGYWIPKLKRNQQRDIAVKKALRESGWTVIRIWEHDLAKVDRTARRIAKAINRSLASLHDARK